MGPTLVSCAGDEVVWDQVEKWNDDFMEPLIEAQKQDAKDRERGR